MKYKVFKASTTDDLVDDISTFLENTSGWEVWGDLQIYTIHKPPYPYKPTIQFIQVLIKRTA